MASTRALWRKLADRHPLVPAAVVPSGRRDRHDPSLTRANAFLSDPCASLPT
jgi:hypothetical protein